MWSSGRVLAPTLRALNTSHALPLRVLAAQRTLFTAPPLRTEDAPPASGHTHPDMPVIDADPVRTREKLVKGKNFHPRAARGKTIDESDNDTANIDALAAAMEGLDSAAVGGGADNTHGGIFPDADTLDQLYGGVRFAELPFVHVRCNPHNTLIRAEKHDGEVIYRNTCGSLGFVGAKKRSSVAAQATGLAMGQHLRGLNITHVRVGINGFNNGRIASLLGLVQAKIQIVSVSDQSLVDFHWVKRAKKRKREN